MNKRWTSARLGLLVSSLFVLCFSCVTQSTSKSVFSENKHSLIPSEEIHSWRVDYSNLTEFNSTFIPLNDVYRGKRRTIIATIQGQKYEFLVDTGAESLNFLIRDSILKNLDYKTTNASKKLQTFYGRVSREMVLVSDFTLGNLKIDMIPCDVLKKGDPLYRFNKRFAGTVGWGFLSNFNILFNDDSLTLYNLNIMPDLGSKWFKGEVVDDTGLVIIAETCSGEKLKCIIDTGAGVRERKSGKILNQFFKNNFQKVFHDCTVKHTGEKTYSVDILINKEPFLIDFVFIDGLDILKDYHAFLSWGFMDKYSLYIDNKNKKFYLKVK